MIRRRTSALAGTFLGLLVGLAGCFHDDGGTGGPPPPAPQRPLPVQIERTVEPEQPRVGEPFTVTLKVTVEKELPAVLLLELYDGLTVLEIEEGFALQEEGTLKGVILTPGADSVHTFRYKAECEKPVPYTLVAEASSKGFDPVYTVTTVNCSQ